ncbi:hypothetical protein RDWZM_000743 [Blomia tropicalis]|uniref:WD40 repeat-like protein n=1 Tax=Blomia tropicalis TaxID=40697 RepID=A0A9Q0M9G1_BLOTA|nr:hypothetical protein RDWZM_000743 [Blomia tropicalis]
MYMSEDSYSRYMENLNFYYSIINNHGITDDGKYLLASIKSGYLAVFPIYKFLNEIYLMNELSNSDNNETSPNIKPERLKPISLVKLQNSHSLCLDKRNKNSSDYRFVTGGKGSLHGKIWSISNQLETSWKVKLPSETTTSNSLALSSNRIISGCSDNIIYVFDKETQNELFKLVGHQDYVHSVRLINENVPLLYSSSEDGSVRVWDLRTPNNAVNVVLPFKNASLARPSFGKWIDALDVASNEEWFVCGGGPKLSVWHIRSGKVVHIIDQPNVTHVAQYMPNDPSSIMFAGNGSLASIWKQTNESNIINNISSTIENIYSISHYNYEKFDYNLTSFSGDSFKLELCKNVGFLIYRRYQETNTYESVDNNEAKKAKLLAARLKQQQKYDQFVQENEQQLKETAEQLERELKGTLNTKRSDNDDTDGKSKPHGESLIPGRDYFPLMGGGSSSNSYRPPKKRACGPCGGGGCG